MKFLDDSYLRGLLFHDSWASNVRNVRRSYPPRHFPRPCFFFNPHPSPSLSLHPSSNQPTSSRVTLNLQRESRFLSPNIDLALVHESPFLVVLLNTPIQCRFQAYYLFFSHLQLFRVSSLEFHGFMTSV